MARRIVLIDDVDGSGAAETVHYAIDNREYEIDLSDANAKGFRSALAPYVEKSRQVERQPVVSVSSRRRSTGGSGRSDLQQIRAWAEEKGLPVSARGRIKKEFIDQYDAEHG